MRRYLSVVILALFTLAGYAQQYEMVFTEYDFGTMYLDYPVTIPTGTNGVRGVYYVSSIEGDEAILTRIRGNIPARTAVMVQGNHNKTYIFKKTDANVPAITGNLLSGSLVDISVTDALAASGAGDNAIVMTYGKPKNIVGYMGFYRYTGKTLKANKAFLIYDIDEYGNVNSLSIKGMEDDTDGISEVKTTKASETWHTLQGVRLNSAPTLPGIYIRNGRAVTVK